MSIAAESNGFLDWATLRAVAAMTDETGVLSIYVTADPQQRTEPRSKSWPWELRLRHELDRVRDQARQDRPREEAKAVASRLDALRLELQRLVDPATTGRGRAMFVGVAGGEVRTVSLQVPLEDRVVLEPRAYLRPLLEAWSAAGPAGVVALSEDQIRVVDLRLSRAAELEPVPVRYESNVTRELRGPAADNPALAQHSASQHDVYERREDDKLARFLRTLGPQLAELARQYGWDYLAVTGEPTLVQAVRDGLPPKLPAEVVPLNNPVATLTTPKLAATVAPALDRTRQQHHRRLAERARGNALSANAGACGLGETLGALQEGRVAHLLLDAERRWSGTRGPDGFLAPAGEIPPGAEPDTVTPESHLGERMIEMALAEAAQVTMLDPEAAAPLADADGVGAILRW